MRTSPTNSPARHPGGKVPTEKSILTSPILTIHRFLNVRNVMALQDIFSLTYEGNNIHLNNSFCKALLQGHILAIPDTDAQIGI